MTDPIPPGVPLLDEGTWRQLYELAEVAGPDLFEELLGLFEVEGPERVTAIERALAAGDAMGVARGAHGLRSTAGTMGASRLHWLATRLEEVASGGDLPAAAPLVAALRAAHGEARDAIVEAAQASPPPGP